MSNYADFFKGKKITVMGLGLLGRGVGDAEFLVQCGAQVTVTDKKSEHELAESVAKLSMYSDITFHLGGHKEEDFTNADMIIKAAGVPLDSPYIAAAKKASVPVYMSTALFAKYAMDVGAIVIGITGTRGKSTIAHLLHHAFAHAHRRIQFGGNIRGVSTLALLPEIEKGDVAVLELDSWQLQGFGDLQLSPHIAVFSNLMPDHLNYYPDMDTYFNDKANIFRNQKSGDFLFVGESIAERIRAANPPVAPVVPPPIPDTWDIKIPGSHNRDNIALAVAALRAAGIAGDEIRRGVESFHGVEGRLQFVREYKGVKIYNDNNATTPEATIAALRALGDPSKKNIVLIMGGDDKKLDMSGLIAEISKWCSNVVLFKERGTDRIRDDVFKVAERNGIAVFEEDGLQATIARAVSIAEKGDVLLYSPAFTSFGKYFKNEFDRNDQFLKIVRAL